MIRFKAKAQVEVWYQKWNVLEYEEDEDISEYATHFKQVYKRVDPHKSTPSRTIIRKFINSLSPTSLDKAIEAVLNVKASQKVKTRKRDRYI